MAWPKARRVEVGSVRHCNGKTVRVFRLEYFDTAKNLSYAEKRRRIAEAARKGMADESAS